MTPHKNNELTEHTIRTNALSPRPLEVQLTKCEELHLYAQVSQRIGNSLCSQPALLISAFGGIFEFVLSSKPRKKKRWGRRQQLL